MRVPGLRLHRSLALALALAGCGGPGSSGGGADGGGAAGADGGGGAGLPRYAQLIRRDPYPRLVVEVDAVPGLEPRPQVADDLAAGFSDILDKPGGVEVVLDGEIASRGSDHAWSFDELTEVADGSFDLAVPDDTIKIHAFFVDGHHEQDDQGEGKILGLSWSHTHLVIFEQTMEEICSASPLGPLLRERQCRGAELSVWTHEVGHLIGLVDNGLPMVAGHKDPDHGAHDASDTCVMYWAYDGEAVFDQIRDQLTGGGSESLGFDQACLDDIAAVRDAASL